ncbi:MULTISPECIES: hypothetical protein [unclassified Nostoc]|uniref:hypothetical protein n=1 Tax=unclassified Nostoc TaxID=2593658 RepID=UPI002AD48E2A|nr:MULTISPECIES: hypothetical protein [unclassified Nostoc]MDZ8124423.1 hypothetical protein [Nostoc sp. CmiVER01]MDZ8227487.1 hypothetical protein [Nostoc sp. ChiVER01]
MPQLPKLQPQGQQQQNLKIINGILAGLVAITASNLPQPRNSLTEWLQVLTE